MIRMIQSSSASRAKKYFNDALSKSDYYVNDVELVGSFNGKLAARLKLQKEVTKEQFHFLCENHHPGNGKRLTSRKADQRTVGYDINFHCPKSVSLLNVLSKDDHVLKAFQKSVFETMCDIETDAKTRIRKKGADENRLTGELLWAEFTHQTARPVKKNAPDPHLHSHCFTFNMTWDKVEQQYKAAQFQFIKRDMPYYQAKFHKKMSDALMLLGYRIKRTKTAYEVEGIPPNVIDMFSKRTNEIGRFAKEHNITSKQDLDGIGARTRHNKQKGMTLQQLKSNWRDQIKQVTAHSTNEKNVTIRHSRPVEGLNISAKDCVIHSITHSFERSSVVQDKRLLEKAFRHGIGSQIANVDFISKQFCNAANLIHVQDHDICYCTTHKILDEEETMLNLASKGKSKFASFYKKLPQLKSAGEKADALNSILSSKDQVSILEGRAGTGKTTLMKEAIQLIEQTGKNVLVVAPTSEASRGVLKDEGFEKAETVSKFIMDKNLHENLRNNVLWVDEAGLLGVQDMAALLRLADFYKARLILSGDISQHSSVARGDALRLISGLCGLSTARISKIYRQKNNLYREAVKAISYGDIHTGFKHLDSSGFIFEIDTTQPLKKLTNDYLNIIRKGDTALIVCPTHHQGDLISNEVRKSLKKEKTISGKETQISRLINLNLTQAEKLDFRNYQPGQVLQFNQNREFIKRGSKWTIIKNNKDDLTLSDSSNKTLAISVSDSASFDVFENTFIPLAKGDRIKITRNGYDLKKGRLNNGQEMKVLGIDKTNCLRVENLRSKKLYSLPVDYGHISYSYCLTSHASQGKTVDEVLLFQPSETFPASDLKQFYVSVSRGKNGIKVYTDDKEKLLKQVSQPKDRMSALELLKSTSESISKNDLNKRSKYRVQLPHLKPA